MNTDPSTPADDANLSALGREVFDTGGSKPSGPWEPPTAEELHQLLPEYDIVRMLGRGGMGAVYMGRQIALDRPVAIKILSSTLEDTDMGFKERFKNEAMAMARLSFVGIVKVHDFGETSDGLLYIVMEYVEGTDVSRMISKSGRLSQDHAMAITAHVCDALAYAHERGIIHRDIKPANIMVGYDGVVKVADFGLAKMSHAADSGLTQSGVAMGTLHYMAPEAMMLGTAVDQRADIFAVGVMLYQMLTGKLPQGMFELPSKLIPGVDPRYDRIIAKALREDREIRYQSADELRADLDGILTQPVVKVEPEFSAAPGALPTGERPRRPTPPEQDEPPHEESHHFEQSRPTRPVAHLITGIVAVLTVLGGACLFWPDGEEEEPAAPIVATPSPPSSVPAVAPTKVEPAPLVSKAISPTVPLAPSPASMPVPVPQVPVVQKPAKPRIDALVADGKWQDVMKILSGPKAATLGTWQFAKGSLKLAESSQKAATIGVTTEALADYDAYISVHSDNHQALGFLLPTAEGAMNLLIHRSSGIVVLTNGAPFKFNKSKQPFEPNPADSRIHEFFVRVTPKKVTVTLDGEQVYEFAPASWAKFRQNVNKKFPLGNTPNLGLRVDDGSATFFNFQIRIPGNDIDRKPPIPVLADLPGFQSRIAKYQAARHQQLAGLCGRYQSALTSAQAAATKTGELSHVEAIMQAITNASRYAAEIDNLPTSRTITALSALPRLGINTPDSLNRLREIFDQETAKIESGLAAELDQSFDFLRAELVETGDLLSAQTLEALRGKTNIRSARLHQATKQRPFVNTLGMKFVPVPGTKLLMCMHETRKGDFRVFANATHYRSSSWESVTWQNLPVSETDDHPVTVRYYGAISFNDWLSWQEKITYRLPTDHEWSIAAGLDGRETPGTSFEMLSRELPDVYVWGEKFPPPRGAGNFADDMLHFRAANQRYIRSYNDGFATTAPVMRFAPNAHGLHDLAGNVWEWCSGWYREASNSRLLRGGGYATYSSDQLNALYRQSADEPIDPRSSYSSPYERGFRCVLELPETAAAPAAVTSLTAPSGSGTQSPAALSSSSVPAAADLTNRPFEFHRETTKGTALICKLRLLDDGSIQGTGNRNETRWELRDGRLLFISASGSATTFYDEFQWNAGKWQFKGPNLVRSGVTHILKEL